MISQYNMRHAITPYILTFLLLFSCGAAPRGPQGPPGPAGPQGPVGAAGENAVIKTIDPCGDDPGHVDEILLFLNDGTIVAWYKNKGLAILEVGIVYVTTDHQKCMFGITNDGEVIEL